MDVPLEPPLRLKSDVIQPSTTVNLSDAHQTLQAFLNEAKGTGDQPDDAESRGTSTVVMGQLQRLADALDAEARNS
ncbi:hypothetical protein FA10DRAFT_264304 [Acaromyces ingoldii]|uniref:Uncharacterized protein n=1 Tax=Acaromyces ingoldii TaxID=215250 RepID=A0A316YVV8_9BASI|nr:hypothetical protein FA10DRAFT_264304 [Acaromyces ingoldii]PWN93690.1 hypothetical protein FA10DRAFT_264304 [Acaromyces ingoldii]